MECRVISVDEIDRVVIAGEPTDHVGGRRDAIGGAKCVLRARSGSDAAPHGCELTASIALDADSVNTAIRAVNKIDSLFTFVKTRFEIHRRRAIVAATIRHSPFDIENAIGKRTADRCENALAGTRASGPQIRPAWRDDVNPIERGAGRSVVM